MSLWLPSFSLDFLAFDRRERVRFSCFLLVKNVGRRSGQPISVFKKNKWGEEKQKLRVSLFIGS